jgi:RNA-directed DNA polymerase
MKRVLEYSHIDARRFFLKEESYFNFDLPKYFTFKKVLDKVSQKIDGKYLSDFYHDKPSKCKPCDYDGVNYILLNNKDGRYAWRPMQLIHPAIYVSLVHLITEEQHWNTLVKRFGEFNNNSNINCTSLPIESDNNLQDRPETVSNWWQQTEQKSIELALQFEYLLHTDIVDCYGAIYTHSIPWALHTKIVAKNQRKEKTLIGNKIDSCLQDMSFGQTNGIPQGSTLMDLIAEMVLGFADLQLSTKLSDLSLNDYKIIRYRDDYRVFTNNPREAELILKCLTEILIELGLRLNSHKTLASNNVVQHSIKPDKLYWILNEKKPSSLQKHLLLIHILSDKFPNSGSLSKALTDFYRRVKNITTSKENIPVLISILVDIALKNPRTYSISSAILSKFLSLVESKEVQNQILNSIVARFNKIPNVGHLEVWLQRVVLKTDRQRDFDEKLCKKVNDPTIHLWNSEWLNKNLRDLIENESIVDEEILQSIDEVINIEEVQLFDSKSNYSIG